MAEVSSHTIINAPAGAIWHVIGDFSAACQYLAAVVNCTGAGAGAVGALRLLVDGSFVTAKPEPEDIDAVMLVPDSFSEQVEQGVQAAMELEEMFLTRQPEELFPAENEAVWQGWCEFFSRTREPDRRRKGLVEIVL